MPQGFGLKAMLNLIEGPKDTAKPQRKGAPKVQGFSLGG